MQTRVETSLTSRKVEFVETAYSAAVGQSTAPSFIESPTPRPTCYELYTLYPAYAIYAQSSSLTKESAGMAMVAVLISMADVRHGPALHDGMPECAHVRARRAE